MGMPYRTPHGNCPWETASALQKFVRRNMPVEGLQAAAELSGLHLAFALNRLRVISHEDIGLGNPPLSAFVKKWTEQVFAWHKAGNKEWRRLLALTILTMCQSPKSREADSFQCVGFDLAERGEPIDTERLAAFLAQGDELPAMHAAAVLALKSPDAVSRKLVGLAAADRRLPASAYKLVEVWAEQIRTWNKSSNGAWRLALADIVLILCRRPVVTAPVIADQAMIDEFAARGYAQYDAGQPVTIPDYALCKHTRRGKKLGRGIHHFRQVGAVLNPAPVFADRYEDAAYAIWERKEIEARPVAVAAADRQRRMF